MAIVFPPKHVGETKTLQFDFSSLLGVSETLSTASVSAILYSGTDPTPGLIISGVATISGAIVLQNITGGVQGAIYELICQVTTSLGQLLQLIGLLTITEPLGVGTGTGQLGILFQDEGVNLGTRGTADVVNFTGAPITATRVGSAITVSVVGSPGSITLNEAWQIIGGGSAFTALGCTLGTTVNIQAGVMTNASLMKASKRTNAGAGVNNTTYGYTTVSGTGMNGVWWGSTNNLGLFYVRMLLAIEEVGITNPPTYFMGLGSAPANINTVTISPSSTITDFFGMLKDRTDTNWQMCKRTGAGAANKTDLGFIPIVGQIFFIEFSANAAATSIQLRVTEIAASGNTIRHDVVHTTVLPTNDTSLGVYVGCVATGTGNTSVSTMGVQGFNNKLTLPTPIAY